MTFPVQNKPHVTKVAGGVSAITGQHETMAISNGEGRLWLQEGTLVDESGKVPDPIPDWFWTEFNKLTPAMKQRHGAVLKLRGEKAEEVQSGNSDTEQDNPGRTPALKGGDDSDKGGDPSLEGKEDDQMSPELKAALGIRDALDVADEENAQAAERGEISSEEDAEKAEDEAQKAADEVADNEGKDPEPAKKKPAAKKPAAKKR